MLHVIANAQKAGGLAAFIDAEHALDPGYAKKLGVNLDDLLVSQPDSGEEALTIAKPSPAPMRSTSLSSIPSPLWCPRPNSRVRWAWLRWACRPGS